MFNTILLIPKKRCARISSQSVKKMCGQYDFMFHSVYTFLYLLHKKDELLITYVYERPNTYIWEKI